MAGDRYQLECSPVDRGGILNIKESYMSIEFYTVNARHVLERYYVHQVHDGRHVSSDLTGQEQEPRNWPVSS